MFNDIPKSVLFGLNNNAGSLRIVQVFKQVFPIVRRIVEGSEPCHKYNLPSLAKHWSFYQVLKCMVKRLEVSGLHFRMLGTLVISRCTVFASMALQLEQRWSRQAGDIYIYICLLENLLCTSEVECRLYGNLACLTWGAYLITND